LNKLIFSAVILLAACLYAKDTFAASHSRGPIFESGWFDPQEKNTPRTESGFGFIADLAVRAEIAWHDGSPVEELIPVAATVERQEIFRTMHLFRRKGTYNLKITLWAADGSKTVVHVLVHYDGK